MGALTNSIDADQMPQNVDYDQDLLFATHPPVFDISK